MSKAEAGQSKTMDLSPAHPTNLVYKTPRSGWELVQTVKCLSCEHEDGSLIPELVFLFFV